LYCSLQKQMQDLNSIRYIRRTDTRLACSSECVKLESRCVFQANPDIGIHAHACGQQGNANTQMHSYGDRIRTMQPATNPLSTATGTRKNPTITVEPSTVLKFGLQTNGMTYAAQRNCVSSARSTGDTKYA